MKRYWKIAAWSVLGLGISSTAMAQQFRPNNGSFRPQSPPVPVVRPKTPPVPVVRPKTPPVPVVRPKTPPVPGKTTPPPIPGKSPPPKGKTKGNPNTAGILKNPNLTMRMLPQGTNTTLEGVQNSGKIDPATARAIEAARNGQLLSANQRVLLEAAKNNPTLSGPQRGAIASALQNDMDEKRKLQASAGNGGGNGSGIIFPSVPPQVIVPGVPPQVIVPGGPQGVVVVPSGGPQGVVVVPGGNSGIITGGQAPPAIPIPASPPAAGGSNGGGGEQGGVDEGNAIPWQTQRQFVVANDTDETLTVSLLYVYADDQGNAQWVPQADQPLQYQVAPRSSVTLNYNDSPILTSRARIWAESESGRKWTKYQNDDLVTVSEAYQSAQLGTYTHRFK